MTLSKLDYTAFEDKPAWSVILETIDDEDMSLEPATFDEMGLIEKTNEMVWCLCKAIFSNGEEYKATAMCRGDADEGPLLCSVFNGVKYIQIFVPPAPKFVLKAEGPKIFCKAFKRRIDEVFPITIEVIPKFQVQPRERSAVFRL